MCSTLTLAFSKYTPTTQRMFFYPMFRNPIVSIESFVKRNNVIPFHNNLFMYLNIVY